MNERFQLMLAWLENLPELVGKSISEPVPASSDASFRRYFRVVAQSPDESTESYIIMDAPVEHEDCRPFIKVSAELVQMGLNVPQVLEQDLALGFLLLTDLGSQTYLAKLQDASETEVDQLYQDALSALVTLQAKGQKGAQNLPPYDLTLLNNEMSLFSDWLLKTHLDSGLNSLEQQAWDETKSVLAKSALAQPKTYVHRDYHSRNLMVTEKANPGILDFQDAVHGALSYDAVSLLRDCYIAWPVEQVEEWQRKYFLDLCTYRLVTKNEWKSFQTAMDLMGIQRHLKASGIFARLFHRDGKDGYLNDIPLTLNYIQQVGSKYHEMNALVDLVERKVLSKL